MKNKIKIAFKNNPDLFAVIIYVTLVCIFYIDKLILGPYATVRIHDTFDTEFPRYAYLGNLFLKHGFFAWNPQMILGMPAYVFHFPPHYILCLLGTIFPSWFIYSALVILLMFTAAYGTYWFMKDFLGTIPELAILGGLLFALQTQVYENPLVCVVFNYTFPLFFMCLMITAKRVVSFRTRILSLVIIFLIIILSYPVLSLPMFFVFQILIIIFLSFERGFSRNIMILKSFLIWLGYVFLSVPILYSLYKYVPFSQRGYDHAAPAIFLINLLKNLVQLFWQHARDSSLLLFIIGLVPLIFYSRKVRKPFFLLMLVIFITALFQRPLLSVFHGSIFEKMDMEHFSWLITLPIILFVIIGIEQFFIIRVPRLLYIFSFSFFCLAFFYLIATKRLAIPEIISNVTVPLFVSSLILFFNKTIMRRKFVLIALILLSVAVVGQFKIVRLIKFENYPYKRIFDSHSAFNDLRKEAEGKPFRVVTTLSFPMVLHTYGLETAESRSPIMPKSYKEFFREMISPQLKTKQQAEQFDTYWYNLYIRNYDAATRNSNKGSSEGLFKLPLLLMINTKYIVSHYPDSYLDSISDKMTEVKSDNLSSVGVLRNLCGYIDNLLKIPYVQNFLPLRIRGKWAGSVFETIYCPSYYVYRLKGYFERGYLVSHAVLLSSDKSVLEALSGASVGSLKNTAFFSKKDVNLPPDFRDFGTSGENDKVRLKSYGPDTLIFEGFITAPRILLVSNNYHPNWTVTVNGVKKTVYRANHTFQAVFLEEPGRFNVALAYKDPMLWKLYWFLPIGMLLIAYSVFVKIRTR